MAKEQNNEQFLAEVKVLEDKLRKVLLEPSTSGGVALTALCMITGELVGNLLNQPDIPLTRRYYTELVNDTINASISDTLESIDKNNQQTEETE